MKRTLSATLILLGAAAFLAASGQSPTPHKGAQRPATKSSAPGTPRRNFQLVEATIPEMRAALEQHRITSVELVQQYLARIGTYEDKLNAAITVNPNALKDAEERDQERAAGKVRGPLHGIPIALKDNIQTTSMPTTGGALAFDGFVPPYQATVTKNLLDAGAIIIAKTGMTELANWVASGMPGDYNAVKGYGMNPYDPRRDPREATFDGRPVMGTGGSSSGIGTSANFWAANIGTETSGSILSPANQTMLAAIKPTVGRVSRYGIIPITADQDTAGPMAKSVADVAIILGALERSNPDPNDPATNKCQAPPGHDYTRFLKPGGLKGMRIGIPRAFFYERMDLPQRPPASAPPTATEAKPPAATTAPARPPFRGGLNADQLKLMNEAIAVLKEQGAVIVDPANIPSVVEKDPTKNFLLWNTCSGLDNARGKDENCSVVLKYGMKRDFNKWLASLGPTAPVKTLTELRKWNEAHQKAGAIKYGQANLDISDEMDVERDRAKYEADRAKDIELAATNGIDAVMKEQHLDALLFPGPSGAAIAAKPGYPTVMVPIGFVPNVPFGPNAPPFPEGFDPKPQPYAVSFTGMACSEPTLIQIAYAFEQATKKRVPPASAP